jgi:hypothetical protein
VASTTYIWPFVLTEGTGSSSSTTQYLTNSTAAAWTNWTTTATTTATTYFKPPAPPRRLTPEEQEAENRRITEHRRRMQAESREWERVRVEANHRAEMLLAENLNDEQAEQYVRNKAFRVRGSRGGVYSIHHGVAFEVDPNDPEYTTHSICIHGTGVPEPDNMLAKKLMIETDEEAFRRIGNFARERRPVR